MKTFKYTARKPYATHDRPYQESEVSGVLEANTQDEAVRNLRADGYVVVSIEETPEASHDIDLRLHGRRTKDKTLAILCSQLATILEAGIPAVDALRLVAEQTEDKTMKSILTDVSADVASGYAIAPSFEKHGSNLPTTFIETVRAGEESGSLDTVFRRLANYYDKTSKSRAKVQSAMIYPAFVMGVAVVVIAIIMIFAVPTFESTFADMGTDLPWPTVLMINTSNFFSNYILLIIGVIVGIVVVIQVLKRTNEDFHLKWSQLGVKMPVFGRITHMNGSSQYAGTMSIMLGAGLSVTKAVDVTSRTLSNYYMAHALASMEPALEAGKPLAETLEKTEAFPNLACQMTGVGEQTGSLEHTLDVLNDYYTNEVDTATERMLSIMEPVMIVILAVIVFLILLAVYMPMFSLYASF